MAVALALMLTLMMVSATTLAKIPIEQFFSEADYVAIVEVIQGRTLGGPSDNCGAIYTGHVIQGFKGIETGTIEFGHDRGREIGGRYLLFLTKSGRTYEQLMSTNSMMFRLEQEHHRRCGQFLKANHIMQRGIGALKITWTSEYNYKQAVQVPLEFVGLPVGLDRKKADLGERGQLDDVVWVLETRMIDFLQTLADKTLSNPGLQPAR